LIVNKLVLTRVDCEIAGDIFYPDIDLTDWTMISDESHTKDADNEYNFKIETYLKN
jgi:dihydrofolate reductase